MSFMNKKILIFIGLIFSISNAQTFSSSAIAKVNMIKPLSITAINSTINFGEIILGETSQIRNLSPSDGAVFRIEGHPQRNVIVSYSVSSLSNALWVSQYGGKVGNLSFLPVVVHTGSSSVYQNPISVSNGGSYQLQNSGGIGLLFVWVGGSINISPGQPVGDYIGTFNITVSY